MLCDILSYPPIDLISKAYLLEKPRLTATPVDRQRNFHIFYEILAAGENEKSRYCLGGLEADNFHYTATGTGRSRLIS